VSITASQFENWKDADTKNFLQWAPSSEKPNFYVAPLEPLYRMKDGLLGLIMASRDLEPWICIATIGPTTYLKTQAKQ
jgi:hypothetical protein